MQSNFLPRTTLTPNESRINFTIMDNPIIDLLTSPEAEKICSKMWLIYTRLKRADWRRWERQGVLGVQGEGEHTAWQVLCEICGVASATLNKALKWMNEHKVIAYFAGKNGVGIRIYFNVAASSIKARPQKNLRLVPTSSGDAPASANEAPSCEDKVFKDIQDSDIRADARSNEPPTVEASAHLHLVPRSVASNEIYQRLSALESNAAQLQQGIQRLIALAPDPAWLEKSALPKAVRVAVAEAMKIVERERLALRNAYVGAHQPQQPSQLPPPRKFEHSAFYAEKLAVIATRVNYESLRTWFEPLNVVETPTGAKIITPDPVFREWIENNYADILDDVGLTNYEWECTNE